MHDGVATWLGAAGVTLLLLAFLLNALGRLPAQGRPYLMLNLAGALLACWSSWLIRFMPFVVLEGVWALVAAAGLLRAASRPRRPPAADAA